MTEQANATITNSKIDWEIDRTKIDFSKLIDFPEYLQNKPFKIEYVPTENSINKLYNDSFTNRDEGMNNLIDFVNVGAKIIPPAFVRIPRILLSQKKEGNIITETFTKQGLCIQDGCHKIFLAKALGIKEIPILIFDFDKDSEFSIIRWVAMEGYEWKKHFDISVFKRLFSTKR